MFARLRLGAVPRPPRRHDHALDAGYTLIELVVSLAVIGVVMTAFTSFFITAIAATSGQSAKQTGIQVADSALEQVRTLKGSAVIAGRDSVSTDKYWKQQLNLVPASAVVPYLASMTEYSDPTLPTPTAAQQQTDDPGNSAAVPTTPRVVTINGIDYTQAWYVGTCSRPPGTDGSCVAGAIPGSTTFYRVVVAVTWSDKSCPNASCSYITSTLVSVLPDDPLFHVTDTTPSAITDTAGPVGGSVDAAGLTGTGGRYSTSNPIALSIVLNKGTDSVGLATTGAQLYRAIATLASTDGTADGTCSAYAAYIKVGADDPPTPLAQTAADGLTDQTCVKYLYVVHDTFGNGTTYVSGDIKIDRTAPTAGPSLTLAAVSNTFVSGTTVYYRPGATSGSFTVTAAATDPGSGIASYNFPSLGTGWTATPGATPAVMTYSWSAVNPTPPVGAQNVTAVNNAGLVSPATGFTATPDSTGPTGGSVDATGLTGTATRYSTSTTLSIALAKGTDAISGVAATGATLTRATATLISTGGTADGTCGTYGFYLPITGGTDPATPKADTVTDQACYRYQYTVTDTLGNPTTYTSGDIKVDTTAPAAPTLAFSAMTNSYVSGNVVYLTGGATSGSFTVTATATDTASGIASYAFPSLGTGWTATPGATGVMTYSWSAANPAASGSNLVTARNNAFLTSTANASATFGFVADSTGPTGGSIDATGLTGTGLRYSTSTTLNLALNKGTDPSGVAATGANVYRATAPLTSAGGTANGTCGVYGSYSLIAGGADPATPKADTVADQACYRYQYVVADNVGNPTTYTSGDIKVDTTAPAAPTLAYSALTNATVTGNAVTYAAGAAGSFTITATTTDTASGLTTYNFPNLGTGWTSTPGATGVMTYSWTANPATPASQNITATNNALLISPTAGFTVAPDSGGPTGGSVDATGLTGTGGRYATSTTLSIALNKGTDPSGVAAGATLTRATATLTNGTCGTYSSYTLITGGTNPATPKADTVTDQACYRYQYNVADTLGNPTTYTSADIKVDTTAPAAPTLAYSALTNATVVGSAISYQAGVSGSFTITATTTDPGSGIATYNFPTFGGTGWTATPGGTGVMTYSWTGTPTVPGAQTVTATNNASLVSPTVGFTVTSDTTGPTGGSVDATGLTGTGGRYSTSTTLSIALAKGSDPSGLAASGATLTRATAALTSAGGIGNGTCGVYGSYALITGGTDPATPTADTVIAQACYRYQYNVADSVGNPTSYTSGDIKVDTTAPAAPTLAFSAFTNATSSGNTVLYRPGATSGSFTVTATATDADSGIASYAFPNLGSGWTSTPGATGVVTYSWAAINPANPGAVTATATNNAFLVSPTVGFTVTPDSTSPAGGSVDATGLTGTGGRYSTSTNLSIALNKGSDANGFAASGATLTRAAATLSGGTCGAYGSYNLVTGGTDPATPKAEVVTDQACYSYKYTVADGVGNQTIYTSGDIKVDTTAPAAPTLAFSALTNATVTAGTVYFRPSATSGSFTVTATTTDAASGIASYAFPNLGSGWTSTPGATGVVTYSWAAINPANPGAVTVNATNNAFLVSPNATFTVTANSTGPTGGSIDATGLTGTGLRYSTSTTLTLVMDPGTDPNGVDTSNAQLLRATAPLTSTGNADGGCGTYGSYSQIGVDPVSPTDDIVADEACYRYQYVVADGLGNLSTYTSGDIKVDSSPPDAPVLSFSGLINAAVINSAVSIRAAASSGSFTVTATATDPASGIASYTFPGLGTGWTSTSGGPGVTTYSWAAPNPAIPGAAQDITVTSNAPLTSAASSFTVSVDSAGPTGGSVLATGLTGTGLSYSTATSLSLSLNKGTDPNGVAPTGAQLKRATAALTSTGGTANGSCGTYGSYALITGGTDPASTITDPVADQACYRYQYTVADTLGNITTYTSTDIKVDTTAPAAPALAFSALSNVTVTGTTLHLGVASSSGSFTVTATTTDTASGIASYTFPDLGSGLTATSGGPGVTTYSWTAANPATPGGAQNVTATNNASLTSAATAFFLIADSAGPTGGSVDATGLTGTGLRYSTSTTLNIALNKGSDSNGLAPTGAQLLRASAPLASTGGTANGVCGTYSADALIATDPVSPVVQALTDQTCYRYRYVVADTLSNSTTYTSGDIKIDTTAPAAPSLVFSALTNASVSGNAVTYRPGVAGSFTVTAATTDAGSGIVSYAFPNLGAGWTATAGALGVTTYSWSGTPAVPGALTVTATDNAFLVSPATSFTVTPDSTGPAGGSVDATGLTGTGGRYSTSTALSIAFNKGTDANGLAPTGALLKRASATLTSAGTPDATCGVYGTYTLLTGGTDPTSPMANTVTASYCYRYQYVVADLVGNTTTYTSGDIKVDTTAPGTPTLAFSALNNAVLISSTVYYNPAISGSFTVTATSSDTKSGILTYNFPSLGTGWTATPGAPNVTTYSWTANPAVVGSKTVTSTNNAFLTSAARTFAVTVDSAGPTGGSVVATGLTGTGARYSPSTTLNLTLAKGTDTRGVATTGAQLLRASAPLTSTAGANGLCGTYTAYALITGGNDPISPVADTVADQSCYRYQYVVADRLGNSTTYTSLDIKVDLTAPAAPSLVFSALTNASVSGNAVTYRPGVAGSFTVTAATTDTASGIVSYAFPSLGTGWTSTVVSTAVTKYSWTANPTIPGAANVTATNNAFLTSPAVTFTTTPDSAGPSGGSVDAAGLTGTGARYSTSTTLSVVLAKGTDPNGLAATGSQLLRATAPLTSTGGADGVCGTYGAYTLIATDPTSPRSDVVADQFCYSYQYVVPDSVGNTTTYSSGDIKVDTTAPAAPAVVLGAGSNTSVSGTTVTFRPGASSGSFTATATATDAASGILSYNFPNLGAGWTSTPGATGVTTYSWAAINPATPVSPTITVTNNAFKVSPTFAFTVTPDSAGPTGGSVDATGLVGNGLRYSTSTTLNIALAKGTDVTSGVAATGATLTRATAPLTNGTCGTYSSYTLVTGGTDPATPKADTVTDAACYRYQYTVADNLGNTTTYTSGDIKVDTTAPAAPTLVFSALTNTAVVAGTVYYRPGATSGSFTVTATATDATSGIASYTFPTLGAGWTATAGGTGVMTYSWAAINPAVPGGQSVTATNNAAVASPGTALPIVADSTGPTGGSVDATGLVGTGGRYSTSTALSIAFAKGSDPSGLAATGATLTRASAPLTNGTCGTYTAYSLVAGGTDPASPKADTAADQTCFRYQYTVADGVGNTTTYTSGDIQVDTTAPAAPTLAFSALTNAAFSGTTVYYQPGVSGSFTVTATTTDTTSGIASYAFPSLGTGWTATPGGTGVMTYSWTGTPTVPGAKTITATNNATGTSPAATFTVTNDSAGPAGGSVDATGLTGTGARYGTPTTLNLILNKGTDAVSGVAAIGATLTRASGVLSSGGTLDGTCGTWTAYTAVTGTADTTTKADTIPTTTPACYSYKYTVADNAGNQTLYTSPDIKIDTTAPAAPNVVLTPNTNAYVNGSTVYYRPGSGGSFTVTATATDSGSGIASYTLPSLGTGWTPASPGTTGTTTYTWTASPTAPGAKTVTATNNAALTSPTTGFTVTADSTVPTVTATLSPPANGAGWNTSGTVTLAGSDNSGSPVQIRYTTDGSTPTGSSTLYTTPISVTTTTTIKYFGTDGAGNVSTTGSQQVNIDNTAPAGSINYTDGYYGSQSVTVTLVVGTDGGSGINAAGTVLQRQSAALSANVCGGYSGFATIGGANPASPYTDTAVVAGTCYRYQYVVTDNAGNQSTFTAGSNVAKLGYSAGVQATSNLVNYWRLGETGSTTAIDSAPTSPSNGLYVNTPTLGTAGALVGDPNKAVTFDETSNEYTRVARQIQDDFSIEFWFKSTAGSGTTTSWTNAAGLVGADVSGANDDFGIALRLDGKIIAGTGQASSSDISILTTTSGYDDGAWHYVVFTRVKSGGALKIYVDGVQRATGTGYTQTLDAPTYMAIGAVSPGSNNCLSGSVDEVATYTRALTATEIAAHYALRN